MTQETRLQFVRRRLTELKGQRREVTAKAGMSYHTMSKILSGARKSPAERSVEKLYQALVSHFPEEVSSPQP